MPFIQKGCHKENLISVKKDSFFNPILNVLPLERLQTSNQVKTLELYKGGYCVEVVNGFYLVLRYQLIIHLKN